MKYFMTQIVNSVRPADQGGGDRMRVSLTLDCGCRVDRTVNASRVLEVEDFDGSKNYFVAGKFICDLHSHDSH